MQLERVEAVPSIGRQPRLARRPRGPARRPHGPARRPPGPARRQHGIGMLRSNSNDFPSREPRWEPWDNSAISPREGYGAMLRAMPKRNGKGIELLADPVRRRMIGMIAAGVTRPSRIALELDLSAATVSYHLQLLRDAGLVIPSRSEIDGRVIDYRLAHGASARILAWLLLAEVDPEIERLLHGIPDPAPGEFDARRLRSAVQRPAIELMYRKETEARAAAERRLETRRALRRESREELALLRAEGLTPAEIRRRRAERADDIF
ncbi:MAG TPA: metalloregulator ArsR/SmtB family transcription factor [Candidatus Limnocylindrales bacterium]|nr:metalloregulator ArsR/SmtB family transcription factor [Candidatus Limnocylindrales bacterium]